MNPLTCVVVEDQLMFLQLMVGMLRTMEGLKVVGTATTAAAGINACRKHLPDLLILDLSLPDEPGQVVARTLAEIKPEARLIVLSGQASSFVCESALQPMLHAVIDKIEAYERLGSEIRELLPPTEDTTPPFTPREHTLLRQIGRGLTNQQIAETLGLSVRTVETHRKNIAAKLDLKGAELVRYAALYCLKSGLPPAGSR
jgi:DNA-binding NarL/FixJ family response regulator